MNVLPSGGSLQRRQAPRNAEHVTDDAIREAMATARFISRAAPLVGLTERQMGTRVRRLGLERPGRGRPKGSRPVVPCEVAGEACSGRGAERCAGCGR